MIIKIFFDKFTFSIIFTDVYYKKCIYVGMILAHVIKVIYMCWSANVIN